MNKQITIHEAVTEQDISNFWEQLHAYHKRDIFSNPASEGLSYFLDDSQYRAAIQTVHDRSQDCCYYLFFCQGGRNIGFALPVLFLSEDGKCFLMEFCIYPEFRGSGAGQACANIFLTWAKERGAAYVELNYGNDERRYRFWSRLGFLSNGMDEWGEPLMLLPPEEVIPFTVERLQDPADWQLMKLENGFLAEIGEPSLTDEKKERLKEAIAKKRITFFLAKRGYRAIGMCSVSPCYSTFTCGENGVFDDFYVEPCFRKKGVARLLTKAAQRWCAERGMGSLMVCCAPCDEERYQSLGFTVRLGTSFSCLCEP